MSKKLKKKYENDSDDSNVLKQLVGNLETALEEEAEEIEMLFDGVDAGIVEENAVSPKRHKVYVIVGVIALFFSIIGIVSSTIFVVDTVRDIANQTALKEEFALFVYPVVITDPPEFDNNQNIPPATVISSAIWRIIISGKTDHYEQDGALITVPAVDVEASARSLFGTGFEIVHQTIDDIEIVFEYDASTNTYIIPSQPRLMTYTPQIKEITNVGELYTLTVSYMAPSPLTAANIDFENKPVKTMLYTVSRSRNKMTINEIVYVPEYQGVNQY